ncbi:MAG: type II toxin-antitoxin system prevent-host-death family antitoxin [Candidatus Dormiibacterota bacterium]
MEYGIRQLKDGNLSGAIRRARQGEEIVVTDRGRPVAKIVPYSHRQLPATVAGLIASRRMELRIPIFEGVSPIPLSPGSKSPGEYVKDQRR